MNLDRLPPGEFRNDVQWVTDCPFSSCRRAHNFEINVERDVGYCWVCGRSCRSLQELLCAFSGKLLDHSSVVRPPKTIRVKYMDPLERACAWDYDKPRAWLQGKNIGELAVRESRIEYSQEQDELYCPIQAISMDLPDSVIYRPLHGMNQVWCHLPAAKSQYYGAGIKPFVGSRRPVLICEGLSDLLATRLHPYGIAVLGSSLLPIWYYWMSKNVGKVYYWFDPDAAGDKAFAQAEQFSLKYQLDYELIRTPKAPKHFAPQIPEDAEFLNNLRRKLEC